MPATLLSFTSDPHRASPEVILDRPPCNAAMPIVVWHLFSLDAPTVAVVWTIFTATVSRTALPLATPLAMALAVWMLYASDRLLDTRHLSSSKTWDSHSDLEGRHFFHYRYRFAFLCCIALAAACLAVLLFHLPIPAIRLYVAEGVVVCGYFLLIHTAPRPHLQSHQAYKFSTRGLPKEVLLGPFFAAAVFIPTISRNPGLRPVLFPLAALFAVLCSLNCLYIYRWEHPPESAASQLTVILVRNLGSLSALFFAISLLSALVFHLHSPLTSTLEFYPLACAASTLILLVLHRFHSRFSAITLRASADAALLTPLMIMPFLPWYR